MALAQVNTCNKCRNKDAVCYCYDCRKFFCDACKDFHDFFFETHKIIGSEKVDKTLTSIKNICVSHSLEFIHYCETCQHLICPICATTNHKGHPFKGVSDIVVQERKDVEETCNEWKRKSEQISNLISTIENSMKTKVQGNHDGYVKDVQAVSDKCSSIIQIVTNVHVTRAEDFLRMEQQQLDSTLRSLKDCHDECISKSTEIESVLNIDHDLTFLAKKSSVSKLFPGIPDVSEPQELECFEQDTFVEQLFEKIQDQFVVRSVQQKDEQIKRLEHQINKEKENVLKLQQTVEKENIKTLEIKEDLDQTVTDLTDVREETAELRKSVQQKDEQIKRLEHQIDKEKDNVLKLQQTVEKENIKTLEIKEDLDQTLTDLTDVREETAQLRKSVQQKDERIKRLEHQIDKEKENVLKLQQTVEKENTKTLEIKEDLDQTLTDLTDVREETAQLRKYLQQKVEKIQELEKQLDKEQKNVCQLKQTIVEEKTKTLAIEEKLDHTLVELTEARDKTAEIEIFLRENDILISQLEREIENQQYKASQLKTTLEKQKSENILEGMRHSETKRELAANRRETNKFKKRISEMEITIGSLQDCIQDLTIEKEIQDLRVLPINNYCCSSKPINVPNQKLIVVAIEIGTAASSYLCWFKGSCDVNNQTKLISSSWYGYGGIQAKTLTAALLSPQKNLICFGHDAQEKFYQLKQKNENHEWYYFTDFKLKLSMSEDGDVQMTTEDGSKKLPAAFVYSASIEYMVSKFTNQLLKRQSVLTKDDISWVLTFPVAPNAPWKKLIRESAKKAGISSESLYLISEPEANLFSCIENYKQHGSALEHGLTDKIKGKKFLIVNLGRGSFDLTVYHRKQESNVHDFNASLNAVGYAEVKMAITTFLENLFGVEVISKFWMEDADEANEFIRSFITTLKRYDPNAEKSLLVRLSVPLVELFEREKGGSFKDFFEKNERSQYLQICADKLKIKSVVIRGFFVDPINIICKTIENILKRPNAQDVTDIFVTGGFAEIPFIQRQIENAFTKHNVIFPHLPGNSVLSGAVLFGQIST